MYEFKEAVKEWQYIPIEGGHNLTPTSNRGYTDTQELLKMNEEEIQNLVKRAESFRYDVTGWRNGGNKWRDTLGLDTTKDKHVLDFGCGFGLESLQFLKTGNRVTLADINESNLYSAQYIINTLGYRVEESLLISGKYPFFDTPNKYDIFYANGVLHHTPKMKEILIRAKDFLKPDGEIRLMLYSDNVWRLTTETEPDIDIPVTEHPKFETFVRAMDRVGNYADWFSEEKLRCLVEDKFDIVSYTYISRRDKYCVAILKAK